MTSGRATDQGGMSEGFETSPRLRMTVDRTNPMTVRVEGGQQEASGQEDEPEDVTGGRTIVKDRRGCENSPDPALF